MPRRLLFAAMIVLAALAVAGPVRAEQATFGVRIAWLKVPGSVDPGSALVSWAQEIRLRTSIDIAPSAVGVRPEDPALFQYPLLIWAGERAPGKLSDQAVLQLRQHLSTGGMLIIDNVGRTEPSQAFDAGVRRELARVLPQPLQVVPPSHVLYRSFYRLGQPVGRRADSHEMEGLRVGKHYSILYTRNDLTGALARQPVGGYALSVVPGGEWQREQAFRLAVNLVMYALCLDYKDDHTHVMHLLRHRRGHRLPPSPSAPPPESEPERD